MIVARVGATMISRGESEGIVSAILAVVAVLVLVYALYRMPREGWGRHGG